MAHEIEQMFYVGEKPWHGLGTEVNGHITIPDAIKVAGLDWKVEERPIYTERNPAIGAIMEKIPTHKALVRSTDNSILGVVGQDYVPLQNLDAFLFFQPFLDQGLATLETAGSLRGGKRVWVLAKIKGTTMDVVRGDAVELYALLAHGHDGRLAARVGLTGIRPVCMNTLKLAFDHVSSKLIRVQHKGNIVQNLENLRGIMDLTKGDFKATIEQYKRLANKQINSSDLEKYVKLVFVGPNYEALEKDGKAKGGKTLENIIPLFEKGRGNDLPGVKGTLWAAYNATTEYLQHYKGKDREVRLDQSWFGASALLNQKALDVAIQMAA